MWKDISFLQKRRNKMVLILFSIDVDVEERDCVVVISGNCKELGQWMYDAVVPLTRQQASWTLKIDIKSVHVGSVIEYRYAVCSLPLGPDGDRKHIIHQWESHKEPRVVTLQGDTVHTDDGTFGIKDGEVNLQEGWLTDQSEVRVMLHSNTLDLFPVCKNNQRNIFGFHLRAREIHQGNEQVYNQDLPIKIKVVNDKEYTVQAQSTEGIIYNENDFVVFSTQVLNHENMVLVIEVLQHTNTQKATVLGRVTLLGKNLTRTRDSLHYPVINDSGDIIGTLQMQYVVIKPLLESGHLCTFQAPYQWNYKGCTFIGHRGMGETLNHKQLLNELEIVKPTERYVENTIGAFKQAAEIGADMVEFDVHVCKDLIPVIYHDYEVPVYIQLGNDKQMKFDIPLTNFTSEELQSIQTSHKDWKNPAGVDDNHLFPTLVEALENVPVHLSFNVEIKYPMENVAGVNECPDYAMDMSVLVDNCMQVLMQHARSRNILISCTDADVCALVRLKQNCFPVLYLNYGPTDKYILYSDPRCSTVEMAVQWALCDGLQGLMGHVDDYVRKPSLIQAIHDANLHLFIWGEENKDCLLMQDMVGNGVEGIVTDNISELVQVKELWV